MNLSSSQFAEKIGVQRSSVSHVISGRNRPSLDFVKKILDAFPDISYEWLISGDGEMIKPSVSRQHDLFSNDYELQESNISERKKVEDEKKQSPGLNKEVNMEEDSTSEGNNEGIEQESNKEDITATPQLNNLAESQKTISKDREKKNIERIILLYSDNTFEVYYG